MILQLSLSLSVYETACGRADAAYQTPERYLEEMVTYIMESEAGFDKYMKEQESKAQLCRGRCPVTAYLHKEKTLAVETELHPIDSQFFSN